MALYKIIKAFREGKLYFKVFKVLRQVRNRPVSRIINDKNGYL